MRTTRRRLTICIAVLLPWLLASAQQTSLNNPVGQRWLLNPPSQTPLQTTVYRGANPGYAFYDPATNGLVRDFTFVSATGAETSWLHSTNVEIRIFIGFGTATNVLIPDLNYLVFKLPVRLALGCVFQTNKPAYSDLDNPAYRHFRQSQWIDSQVQQGAATVGNYYLRLKFPMQYTNGIEIILWDSAKQLRVTNGWFSTAFERAYTSKYPGWLTRTMVYSNTVYGPGHGTNTPLYTNNIVLLTNNGPGVFLGTCLSSKGGDGGDDSWMEGRMTIGTGDNTNLWQSSGIEDYFHNPYYFEFSTYLYDTSGTLGGNGGTMSQNIGWDSGLTYAAPGFSGEPNNAKEAYRWFGERDAPVWNSTMYFQYRFNTSALDGGMATFDKVPDFRTISFYISPSP